MKPEESLLFGVEMIKEIDNHFVPDDSSNASMNMPLNANKSAEQIARDDEIQWNNFKIFLKPACI